MGQEDSNPYVAAIALLRALCTMALDVKTDLMQRSRCTERFKTDVDWGEATPSQYATLCPARMGVEDGITPDCPHWLICFDAMRLRYLATETAELFVPLDVFFEVKERLTSYLLKKGAWKESEAKPTPGRDAIMEFASEMLKNRDGFGDSLVSLCEEIGA